MKDRWFGGLRLGAAYIKQWISIFGAWEKEWERDRSENFRNFDLIRSSSTSDETTIFLACTSHYYTSYYHAWIFLKSRRKREFKSFVQPKSQDSLSSPLLFTLTWYNRRWEEDLIHHQITKIGQTQFQVDQWAHFSPLPSLTLSLIPPFPLHLQSDDLVEVYTQPDTPSTTTRIEQLSLDPLSTHTASSSSSSSPPENDDDDPDESQLAELLWSKSAVYRHPSPYGKDNLAGFLSIVRVKVGSTAKGEQQGEETTRWNHLVSWIPEQMVQGTSDYDAYVLVELSSRTSTFSLHRFESTTNLNLASFRREWTRYSSSPRST